MSGQGLSRCCAAFDGLYGDELDVSTTVPYRGHSVGFGAFSDSFYEYLLKLWLQSGGTDTVYRQKYDRAMDGMHKHLLTHR